MELVSDTDGNIAAPGGEDVRLPFVSAMLT